MLFSEKLAANMSTHFTGRLTLGTRTIKYMVYLTLGILAYELVMLSNTFAILVKQFLVRT